MYTGYGGAKSGAFSTFSDASGGHFAIGFLDVGDHAGPAISGHTHGRP